MTNLIKYIFRSDFEAERDARTQIASEKEEIVSNLQILHRRNQDLTEEVSHLSLFVSMFLKYYEHSGGIKQLTMPFQQKNKVSRFR